jgi:hypothetical protein
MREVGIARMVVIRFRCCFNREYSEYTLWCIPDYKGERFA